MVEPWLRGTLTEVDAVRRQVLHALELALEDAERWCAGLSDGEMHASPLGLTPVAFHLRHIARSLDRLLSYAEARQLDEVQLTALEAEETAEGATDEVMRELRDGLERAAGRIRAISPKSLEDARLVGRLRLPTTVGGLLVHCAEHTQRHVGQAITTAKGVTAMRASGKAKGDERVSR